jgi:tape measure domain-containing protein
MISRTDAAMTKMLGASRAADGLSDAIGKTGKKSKESAPKTKSYGDGLENMGRKAERANGKLRTLIGTMASLAALKGGMGATDTYTNTSARLSMITSSPEEQTVLKGDIFAAARRSRGDYTDMANAVAKMKMLAGDTFGTNQEAVGFTELLNKSLKVSGAGQAEQNSAFLQLTQAMAAGKLQGDEFRSVMENAPMVANAISQYMGVSKGELKELSSDGVITADIIKNAMFQAADDINGKFDSMPRTFADVWNGIKNTGIQAFGRIMTRVNEMLNSDIGQSVIGNLTGAIYLAADAADLFLGGLELIAENMDLIAPIAGGLVAAFAAYNTVLAVTNGLEMASAAAKGIHAAATNVQAAATAMQSGVTFMATVRQYGFNAALAACPITWIVGGLILITSLFYAGVAAVNHFAGTSISATGMIVGALFAAGALIGNLFIGGYNFLVGIWIDVTNLFISFAEFFANFLNNPVLAIMNLIADLANFVMGVLSSLAKAIDTVFGCNLSSMVNSWSDSVNDFKDGISKDSTISYERIDKTKLQFDRISYKDAYNKGYGLGKTFGDKASGLLSGFGSKDGIGGSEPDFSGLATAGNPAVIKGTGKGGAVKVETEKEDIEWMRKLAERDYVARIAQNTLAPNIRVEFSGPITKEADTDSVMSHVVEELREIIETAPEGVPT